MKQSKKPVYIESPMISVVLSYFKIEIIIILLDHLLFLTTFCYLFYLFKETCVQLNAVRNV